MEHRHGRAHPVLRRVTEVVRLLEAHVGPAVLGVHDRFRQAGRPAREEDERPVFRANVPAALLQFFVTHLLGSRVRQRPVSAGIAVEAHEEDFTQAAHAFQESVTFLAEVDVPVTVTDEEEFDIGVAHKGAQFGPLQARIEQDRNCANAVQCKNGQNGIRLCFTENGHVGALSDTQAEEAF